MKIEKISIDKLKSPSWNPRYITDDEMTKLKSSIEEFGYVDPIIVNRVNNHIVGGNQRYYALKELNYTSVDVIFIEEPDINREKALNIALNKISGDFDTDKLKSIFADFQLEHFDVSLTGFDDFEIEAISDIDVDFSFDDDSDDDVSDSNDTPDVDIKGEEKGTSYALHISFTNEEDANDFLKKINLDKTLTGKTMIIDGDNLEF